MSTSPLTFQKRGYEKKHGRQMLIMMLSMGCGSSVVRALTDDPVVAGSIHCGSASKLGKVRLHTLHVSFG